MIALASVVSALAFFGTCKLFLFFVQLLNFPSYGTFAKTSYIEQNRMNVESSKNAYKRWQSIVEHPYGTIKRQWGFDYILTKKCMERASTDVGFIFIAYNLRRIMNSLGQEAFKKYLRMLALKFSQLFSVIGLINLKYERGIFLQNVT